jgi:hypothetical protein
LIHGPLVETYAHPYTFPLLEKYSGIFKNLSFLMRPWLQ